HRVTPVPSVSRDPRADRSTSDAPTPTETPAARDLDGQQEDQEEAAPRSIAHARRATRSRDTGPRGTRPRPPADRNPGRRGFAPRGRDRNRDLHPSYRA